jgi:hypothetical protein
MGSAKVPVEHAERCLGHLPPKIVQNYDWHTYYNEMRAAYELLAREIEKTVNPPADNVVSFPQQAT